MKIYNISENKKQNFNKGNQIFISLFLQITSLKVSAFWGTSGQYGDISRYTLPPHTTKRRTTTNLNNKNNQNCQKIKLYGSENQGVKEETFIQTIRRGRNRQPGQRGLTARQWVANQWPHIRMQINWAEQLGSETDHTTQDSSSGK